MSTADRVIVIGAAGLVARRSSAGFEKPTEGETVHGRTTADQLDWAG